MADRLTTYVALLRGINVGGHTAVNMAELKACFEEMGFKSVKTYINSGNVIFKTSQKDPRALETKIEAVLESRFSHSIRVVVRNLDEMEQLISKIPKKWTGNKELRSMVMFLSHKIDNKDILSSIKAKPELEELYYYPGALLWSVKFKDVTKSGVLKLNSSPLYKEMTVRNLNTTFKIYELMGEAKAS